MKEFRERIAEISSYLQRLIEPAVLPEVQEAVERRDRNAILEICRKLKIPQVYTGNIASVLLSVVPDQKWPDLF